MLCGARSAVDKWNRQFDFVHVGGASQSSGISLLMFVPIDMGVWSCLSQIASLERVTWVAIASR